MRHSFNFRKSEMNLIVLFFSGCGKLGAAHSDLLILLSAPTPARQSTLSPSNLLQACGTGHALLWHGLDPGLRFMLTGAMFHTPGAPPNKFSHFFSSLFRDHCSFNLRCVHGLVILSRSVLMCVAASMRFIRLAASCACFGSASS